MSASEFALVCTRRERATGKRYRYSMNKDKLFSSIETYFLAKRRLAKCELFAVRKVREEGWFKGETIALLDRLQANGNILPGWRHEWNPLPGKKSEKEEPHIDFIVPVGTRSLYLQLKALCLTQEGDHLCKIERKADSVGTGQHYISHYMGRGGDVEKDIHKKLLKVGGGYCVLFVYPFPKPSLWQENVEKLVGRMRKRSIDVQEETTCAIEQYDKSLYIARLKIVV